MKRIEDMTRVNNTPCIQFHRQTEFNLSSVIINNGTGCSATVGRNLGLNKMTLMHTSNVSCMKIGTIQHELLHILGFYHEQSRPDRDLYVLIQWENIEKNGIKNFEKYNQAVVNDLQTPYDYGSIMHYPQEAFGINGSLTLIPIKNINVIIGQRNNLSLIDIIEIQRYYECIPFGLKTTTPFNSSATRYYQYLFIWLLLIYLSINL
ncbi:unnamed protein product [Rotaria sp. Silwood2]|nr:unnamed protein product [Rotaria sp. Silwood2]